MSWRSKVKKGELSAFFTWEEAACNDGTPVPEALQSNALLLGRHMDRVRAWFGAPITPNSWYRTEEYNSNVGGAKESLHLKALAMDFIVKGWDAPTVYDIMERLIANQLIPDGGLGRYSNWTHYDLGRPRRWVG